MSDLLVLLMILFTGINAGLFFAWSISVTNGIRHVSDANYLHAFQQMNRAILNPLFFLVFLGAIGLNLFSIVNETFISTMPIDTIRISANVLFVIGIFFITAFGNIPLNNMLDALQIDKMTDEERTQFRARYEQKWNNLNWIRTASSSIAFALLMVDLLY